MSELIKNIIQKATRGMTIQDLKEIMRTLLFLIILVVLSIDTQAQYHKKDGAIQCLALEQPTLLYCQESDSLQKVDNQLVYVIIFNDKIIFTDDDFDERMTFYYSKKGLTENGDRVFAIDTKTGFILDKDISNCVLLKNGKTQLLAIVNTVKTLGLMRTLGLSK